MHDDINEATMMMGGEMAPLARAAMPAMVFGVRLAEQLYTLDDWTREVGEMWEALAEVTEADGWTLIGPTRERLRGN
jgi:hypothetical protein